MTPTRTCVGCRRALSAGRLVRVVRRPDGSLAVDRHATGRGAWLCAGSLDCLEGALRRQGFERAFRAPVEPGNLEVLRDELAAACGGVEGSMCEDEGLG